MSDAQLSKDAQIKKHARELVRGSIIEDAASRFVEMVLKEVHGSRIKPLHDRIDALEADNKRLREVLDVDPWYVGFAHWKAICARAKGGKP